MTTSRPSPIAARLAPFGTTIFTEMTRLANQHGAVNLAQGFPDFDGPEFVKDAAARAMADGQNQYARMFGLPVLNTAIAETWKRDTGAEVDPDTQVTVTSGCTEALAAAMLGLVNPGDEVILFEPYYDSYRACVAFAGGVPRFVALRPGAAVSGGSGSGDSGSGATTRGSERVVQSTSDDRTAPAAPPGSEPPGGGTLGNGAAARGFMFDPDELRRAFTPKTRAILVNTPHNPTGKVFSRAELDLIASLCVEHDVIAITDEVYERLVFEPSTSPHIHLAMLPGMAERTVTLSSLGKTFSFTGWKIGWAVASPELTRAVRAAHQFLTFATATPLQVGAAAALREGDGYVRELVEQLRDARAFLGGALERLGFRVYWPAGTYFIIADHSAFGRGSDVEFCRWLTTEIGVAAIPPSVFYEHQELGRPLARFAFCKRRETLERAVERLEQLRRG